MSQYFLLPIYLVEKQFGIPSAPLKKKNENFAKKTAPSENPGGAFLCLQKIILPLVNGDGINI